MVLVECWWCCGTAVDEDGYRCLACDGDLKVSWSFVRSMRAEDKYPVEVRLAAEGASFVAAVEASR